MARAVWPSKVKRQTAKQALPGSKKLIPSVQLKERAGINACGRLHHCSGKSETCDLARDPPLLCTASKERVAGCASPSFHINMLFSKGFRSACAGLVRCWLCFLQSLGRDSPQGRAEYGLLSTDAK